MAVSPLMVLSCLHEDLSDQGLPTKGEPWPDISIKEFAALAISKSLLSKFAASRSDLTKERALDKFVLINQRCGEWRARVNSSKTETLLGILRRNLDLFWHKYDRDFKCPLPLIDHPDQILAKAKLGPGANIGAVGNSLYAKLFSSRLTCSDPQLYNSYRRYFGNFPNWFDAELKRLELYGPVRITASSRLSFVPKNDEIDRCICVEPTLNTFFQLGIAHILEDRLLERYGISLSKQPFLNRDLARLGSITDGLCTIDLSSASDSMSLGMLEYVLPKHMLNMLKLYRCESIDIKGRGAVPLNMISTMGNGYTFPLQTILFASVVTACFEFRDIPWSRDQSCTSWGVFGDDIICPKQIVLDVLSLLDFLGFTVNGDKTFVEGPFRESCGADFFKGVDVRGIYLKKLDTFASRYSAINQLVRFSTKTDIRLTKTLRYLTNTVKAVYVPPWEDMSSGIHVPLSMIPSDWIDQHGSISYRAFVPSIPKVRIKEDYIVVPKGMRRLRYNPSGLFLSFLLGEVNSSSIGVRTDNFRWKRKRRVAPYWEKLVSERDHPDYGLDWHRWESDVVSYVKTG